MKIFLNELNEEIQNSLALEVSRIIKKSPLFTPTMPIWGTPFKTKITNAGDWGWKSDKSGYGYIKKNPRNGKEWPEIPEIFIKVWSKFSGSKKLPNCSLINVYENYEARLGLHQDKDENDYSIPVVSISLGYKAIFHYGKEKKNLKEIILTSGSVIVMGGYSRLFYHSIPKILKDNSNIFRSFPKSNIPKESRVNITMRRFISKK